MSAEASATPKPQPTRAKPTRVPPTRKPQPTRNPQQRRVPGYEIEERCIEQFMIINQRGRYAPGMMSDANYMRALENLYSKGLLNDSHCGLTWDRLR